MAFQARADYQNYALPAEPEPAEATTEPAVLTGDDIAAGVRDALRVGTDNVVGKLGAVDGFNADPKVHIPLPDSMLSPPLSANRRAGLDVPRPAIVTSQPPPGRPLYGCTPVIRAGQ